MNTKTKAVATCVAEPKSPRELFLEAQIAALEQQIEELSFNERRYEIVASFSEVTTFEYNLRTGMMTTSQNDYDEFRMPPVLPHGYQDILDSGVITERSRPAFRELYAKIHRGEPSASAVVSALDINGAERFLELQLANIFDKEGKPVRAIGVRKDVTETMLLEKEKQYGDSLASTRQLTYEVNLTTDRIISCDKNWSARLAEKKILTFSGMMETLFFGMLAPEHLEKVRAVLSRDAIMTAFDQGQRLVTFEYRVRPQKCADYRWYEQTLNIIRDRVTGDSIIRAYVMDIDERKQKELKALSEQRHYESMFSKSSIVYEVNVTRNEAISGYSVLAQRYDILFDRNYTVMLNNVAQAALPEKDRKNFLEAFSQQSLLRGYEEGRCEFTCDHRVLENDGSVTWMCSTMHLFVDPQTDDIRGFGYVEDINEEKLRELALLYRAQHDALTGFYDKGTAQEKMDAYLSSPEGSGGRHAFFIIDLDCFKSINDHFGHAFGDTILARAAGKLRGLFRKGDILGRIGGDEFAILMKNIPSYKAAQARAQELCDCMLEVYTQGQTSYNISISVGVAYYSKHGKCYTELYRNSDQALYHAKRHGKNCFAVYQPGFQPELPSEIPTVKTAAEDVDKN